MRGRFVVVTCGVVALALAAAAGKSDARSAATAPMPPGAGQRVVALAGAGGATQSNPPIGRAALPTDLAPLGTPALPGNLEARGIQVDDAVVSNTDRTLIDSSHVSEGEPVIAVDPQDPNRIVLQTGRDGWEVWTPGGCTYDPVTCPQGANADKGSIWASKDGGATWTKYYDIPLPPGVDTGACTCDRVTDWGADGRLADIVLVFNGSDYVATTTDPTSRSAWRYPVDGKGVAIPAATHDALPVTVGPVGTAGFADQPQTIVVPDPVNRAQLDVYMVYQDDGSRGYDARYPQIVKTAHGDNPPIFSLSHQLWPYPPSTVADPPGPAGLLNSSVPAPRLTGDSSRGWVYALWGVALATADFGPGPYGQQFDVKEQRATLVDYRLVRSTDGGVTWQLDRNSAGIDVAQAWSKQTTDKFATYNALLGGDHAAAVDPRTGDLYYVFGDMDLATLKSRLAVVRVRRNLDGTMTVGRATPFTGDVDAALPAAAVTDDGTLGILYDTFDGMDANGYAVVSAHLAQRTDAGHTFEDTVLEQFSSVEREDPNDLRQRPLGDYQELKAVGNTFYGVFTGNGVPFGRPFADWDPIFVRAQSAVSRRPLADAAEAPDVWGLALTGLAAASLAIGWRRRRWFRTSRRCPQV